MSEKTLEFLGQVSAGVFILCCIALLGFAFQASPVLGFAMLAVVAAFFAVVCWLAQ